MRREGEARGLQQQLQTHRVRAREDRRALRDRVDGELADVAVVPLQHGEAGGRHARRARGELEEARTLLHREVVAHDLPEPLDHFI